ncbi:MAG: hypothetical protein DRP06_02495 [Candidatus Aenigmatarchaeota archaeon]|nr:MAG: hypothetical protein DRP06_02495 [Candidatus Aenigmarchaeota archaeon]
MVFFSSGMLSGYIYYIIPLIFTFALVFGVLSISKIFDKKEVNGLIAISMALFSLISEAYVALLYSWLPYLCILFIVLFVFVLLKNLLLEKNNQNKSAATWEMLIAIGILFLVFMTVYQSIPLPSGSMISSDDILLITGLVFVVLILSVGSKLKEWPGGAATTS